MSERRRLHTLPAVITLAVVALLAGLLGAAAPAADAGKPAPPPPSPIKNVILLIGDGMGPEHTELGSLMYGPLAIETTKWQAAGWLDTTSLSGITWSCAAATALATGYETYNNWVGMSPGPDGSPVSRLNALEAAEAKGKATGIVTDVYIQDATPAAFSAHVPDRSLKDSIAEQQVSKGIEVLFGAHMFRLATYQGVPGVTYSSSLTDLQPYLDGKKAYPTSLWGFYGANSMVYDIDREEEQVVGKEPSLPQLTQAALGVLEKDQDGFFLMVEGGAIDWVAHYRDAAATALEVKGFNDTIKIALTYAQTHPGTLLVVTTDHETGGLAVNKSTLNTTALGKQSASTEWMWGLISADPTNRTLIRDTLAKYAGIRTLTTAEVDDIVTNGEMGISNVLAARANVQWGWSGHDEGDHTATPVPVRAWGPGSAAFAAGTQSMPVDNEIVGRNLLSIYGQR